MDNKTGTTHNARRWVARVVFVVLLVVGVFAIAYRPSSPAPQEPEKTDERRRDSDVIASTEPDLTEEETATQAAPRLLRSTLYRAALQARWEAQLVLAQPQYAPFNPSPSPPKAPPPPPPPPGRFYLHGYCPDDYGIDDQVLDIEGVAHFPCWHMGNDEFVAAERISMLGAQAKRPIDKKPQNGVRLWVNLDGCRTLAHWLEEDPELRLVLRLDDEQLIAIVDPAPVIRDGFLDLSAKKLSALLDKDEKLEDLCFDNRPPAPNNVPTMPSPKPPAANVAKLVEGNTRFALSLLRQLSKPSQDAESKSAPKNLFFSPYSLSIALAMTLAGARGETAKQMASTLEFQLDAKALHPAFASLAVQLDQAGVDRDGTRRVFELVVANSLWPAKGLDLHAPYLELAKRYYAVAIEAVDFAHELEAAVQTINDWVSTQTRERIPSVLDTRAVSPVTLLVLTNAVYFNAKWKDTFEPLDTRPQVFHAPTGDVQVPMMSQRELLRAAQVSLPLVPETDGAPAAALSLELLEMPYEGERMALTVLMPSEGSLAELVAALSVEELAKVLEQLESEHLALSFPKFELRSRFQLSDTLSAMGMVDAFGPKADFKGITNAPLCIDKVMHEATIELDERGTIAAAATAIVGVPYGLMKPKYRKLEINRPFLYLIRDTETGTILFVGLLYDPS